MPMIVFNIRVLLDVNVIYIRTDCLVITILRIREMLLRPWDNGKLCTTVTMLICNARVKCRAL